MKTIFKMAIKNLYASKAKFFITLGLIGIGSYFIVLGLGILNFATIQTRDVAISDFSGDILLVGKSSEKVNVDLFGAYKNVSFDTNMPDMPYLTKIKKIQAKLDSMDEIASYTKMVVSYYTMLKPVDLSDNWEAKPDTEFRMPVSVFLGINPDEYKKSFATIQMDKKTLGVYPQGDEKFVILPMKIKKNYEGYYERELKKGDEVLLSSFANKGARQQKVKIAGFFNYAHPDTPIDDIAYADLNTTRILADMTMGARTASKIPEDIDLSLSEKSEEDLFGEDSSSLASIDSVKSKVDFANLLGDTQLRDNLNMADNEAWHHTAIKLKNSADTQKVIEKLNTWFDEQEISAIALNWEEGMARFVEAIKTMRILLIAILIILAVVVLVVIMNTLVAAVMQRTAEIGTMRAIGAKKSFVKRIFYAESLFMSLGGVLSGIFLAVITALIINALQIELGEILGIMLGSKILGVNISLAAVFWTAFAMLLAGIVANWYPVRLALKVSPLEALNK